MGPSICLLVATWAGCDRLTAIAMLIGALAFNGAACQTNLQNQQDLAPNFAGSLYGIMNTFGSFAGFMIPPIIGFLTNEHASFSYNNFSIYFKLLHTFFTSSFNCISADIKF